MVATHTCSSADVLNCPKCCQMIWLWRQVGHQFERIKCKQTQTNGHAGDVSYLGLCEPGGYYCGSKISEATNDLPGEAQAITAQSVSQLQTLLFALHGRRVHMDGSVVNCESNYSRRIAEVIAGMPNHRIWTCARRRRPEPG